MNSFIIFLGINATRYEAFLTDEKDCMEDLLIPKIVVVLHLFSALVMLITTLVLKIMYNGLKKTNGPKKNTISFRSLNIFCIVMMFITAIPFGFNNVVLIPFVVSVAGNTILICILVLNKESLEYVKSLMMKWKHTRDEEGRIESRMKTRTDQWAYKRGMGEAAVSNSHFNQVIVIDMEA